MTYLLDPMKTKHSKNVHYASLNRSGFMESLEIWIINLELIWFVYGFLKFTEKEKDKGSTEMGRIRAAAVHTVRGLAAGRHWAGPAARSHVRKGHMEGSFATVRFCCGETAPQEVMST